MKLKRDTKNRGLARKIYIPYILALENKLYFDVFTKHKENPTIKYILRTEGENTTILDVLTKAALTDSRILADLYMVRTELEKVITLLT